jgi:hypothetical protein
VFTKTIPEDNLSKFLNEIDWFEIQKLSNDHDLKDFCCGESKDDADLDLFLKEDAIVQQNEKINVTHVAVLKGTKKVIGYVTTLTDKLRVSNKEKDELNITAEYSDFPSVKIGRLAVDKNYCNRKIASTMLQFITGLILESSLGIGCRFIIVDSYPKSVDFYLKKGFVLNLIQDQSRIKVLKEKQDGSREIVNKNQRETISLRYDILNPIKPII